MKVALKIILADSVLSDNLASCSCSIAYPTSKGNRAMHLMCFTPSDRLFNNFEDCEIELNISDNGDTELYTTLLDDINSDDIDTFLGILVQASDISNCRLISAIEQEVVNLIDVEFKDNIWSFGSNEFKLKEFFQNIMSKVSN